MTLINLTGYSYSGKGAVGAILREFVSCKSFQKGREFELFRLGGGVLDLRNVILNSPSPARVDLAVRNFKSLCKVLLASRFNIFDISTWFRVGQEYEVELPGLGKALEEFIDAIVDDTQIHQWPYPMFYDSPFNIFVARVKNRLKSKQPEYLVNYCLDDENKFDEAFENLITKMVAYSGTEHLVIDNAIDPMLLPFFSGFLKNMKHIVVDRDPRLVFLAQVDGGIFKNVSDDERVNKFINQYLYVRRNSEKITGSNYLRVDFEDLLLDYDTQIDRLTTFLDLKHSDHTLKKMFFVPELSQAERHKRIISADIAHDLSVITEQLSNYIKNSKHELL